MTGRQGSGESATSVRRLTAAEKRDQAFAMKKGGATYTQIAVELGCSRGMAHKMVVTALKELPPLPDLSDFRRGELERTEDLIAAMWPKVLAGDAEAVRAVVRIMERRARLAGADVQPSLNAIGNDIVQGAFDSLIGLAVRMLAEEQRPAFLEQVETTMLQIEPGESK